MFLLRIYNYSFHNLNKKNNKNPLTHILNILKFIYITYMHIHFIIIKILIMRKSLTKTHSQADITQAIFSH